MQKGRLIAIVVGVSVAIAIGAAFAFTSTIPNGQQEFEPAEENTEGRNIVVTLEEKLGIESP